MNTEYLQTKLYKKAHREQEEFILELKKSDPEKIIERAYEQVIREDILAILENNYLPPEKIKELLKLEYPLATCYNSWLRNDYSHMEMLRDTISELSSRLKKEEIKKEHIKVKKHRKKIMECR